MTSERELWQALSVRERAVRLAPLTTSFGLAFVLAFLTRSTVQHPWMMFAAAGLVVLTGVTILASVWARWNEVVTLIPVTGLCLAVHLMRAASGTGNSAGYGSLLLVPVVWQAMRRNPRELYGTIVVVSCTNVASVFWVPSTATIAAQWRSVVLFSVIATTIGLSIHRLVHERIALHQQIAELAKRDALTGLGNRRMWDERFDLAAADAARTGRPLTVAVIDLDHFKAFNDQRGHEAGDDLLREAADAWAALLRTNDLLVRWGGEEFALLLPGSTRAHAEEIVWRLLAATPHGQTFSAGITVEQVHPGAVVDQRTVMQRADLAMYEAKANGRARVVSHDPLHPAPIRLEPALA